MTKASKKKMLKLTLIRSRHGRSPHHRKILESLGLRNINKSVQKHETDSIRGMINKVSYLLKVEEV